MSFNQAGKSAKRKSFLVLFSLALILLFAVGGTLAYIVTSTNDVKNTFEPAQVACEVEEQFDGTIKSDVKIRNTGDIDAYIRAAVIITWKDSDGNISAVAPVAGTDYNIIYQLGDWIKGSDGYYYFKNPVAAGAVTGTALIDSCELLESCNRPGDNYDLSVEILADAIQSTPDNAVEESWKAVHVVDAEGVKQLEAVSASGN